MTSKRMLIILAAVLSALSALTWFLYQQDMLGPLDPREEWEKPLGPEDAARTGDIVISRKQALEQLSLLRRINGSCNPPKISCTSKASRAEMRNVTEAVLRQTWLQMEAKEQGIVPNAKLVSQIKRDYGRMKLDMILSRREMEQMARIEALQQPLLYPADKVSDPPEEEIRQYWKNSEEYNRPARRSGRFIALYSRRNAEKARKAWVGRLSFERIIKRYTKDSQTLALRGQIPLSEVARVNPKELQTPFFALDVGEISRPFKVGIRWWLVQAQEEVPYRSVPYSTARPRILKMLRDQAQGEIASKRQKDFVRKWRAKTRCAKDLANSNCKNGPPSPILNPPQLIRK